MSAIVTLSHPVEQRARAPMKGDQAGSNEARAHVRFAPNSRIEQVQYTISRLDMTEREIRSCWWTSEEQDAIHLHARTIVQRTKQHPQNDVFVAKTLNRAYHKACRSVNSIYSQDPGSRLSDLEVSAICINDELLASKSLRCWTTRCEARHGLEKYLITEERQVHAALHRENVLSAASSAFIVESLAVRDDTSSVCSVSTTVDDELIGLCSVQTSAVSRIFARMIGEADAHFVKDNC
jgi:hypothetical protein